MILFNPRTDEDFLPQVVGYFLRNCYSTIAVSLQMISNGMQVMNQSSCQKQENSNEIVKIIDPEKEKTNDEQKLPGECFNVSLIITGFCMDKYKINYI